MNIYLLYILATTAMLQLVSSQQVVDEGVVDCIVRTLIADVGDHNDSVNYECITYSNEEEDGSEDMAYILPDWIISKLRPALEAQPTNYLRIHGASKSRATLKTSNLRSGGDAIRHQLEDSIIIADEATSRLEFSTTPLDSRIHERRHLIPSKTGSSTLLMVRVTTNDGTPSLEADILSERAFGSVATVKSTYEECSFGKLKIKEASGTNIVNGVAELSVNANIVETSIRGLENTLNSALKDHVGNLDRFDHIAFCVPRGSTFNGRSRWLGYAYIESRSSFFNDENCGMLSKLVHELGHNLGLGHSGREGISNYADQSGIMGWASDKAAFPVRCFNAAKNWQLGWYKSKSETINVQLGAWAGRLYGYVDYAAASTGTVLIQVGDIYIQYNRISGPNRDTVENINQVAVIRSNTTPNSISSALAGLDKNTPSFQIPRFLGNTALVIEICDHTQGALDYFAISIRLSDQSSNCGSSGYAIQPTSPPTPPPTASPVLPLTTVIDDSPGPIHALSPSPTSKQPTLYPTTKPISTPSPTKSPTKSPTLPAATPAPVAPSPDPTMAPSQSPTNVPTQLESTHPSGSQTPSVLPTSMLTCDDHPSATFPTDDENGHKRCIWLAARPTYKAMLCVPSHPAYNLCEETCGACTDECEDTEEKVEIDGVKRPCSWLSIRYELQSTVCVEGHDAMSVCPETCGTCDQ